MEKLQVMKNQTEKKPALKQLSMKMIVDGLVDAKSHVSQA